MKQRILKFHHKLGKKGIYSLAGRSLLRLLLAVFIVGIIIYILQTQVHDFSGQMNSFLMTLDWRFVLSLFFISETVLGMIPPDFFIVWANAGYYPYIMTAILALLSYLGGLTAYYIGFRLSKIPKVNKWLLIKFSSHFATFHKYGGILIVFSALLPLPFSTVTLVTGMLHYPFKKIAILGSSRILRFFGYGYILSLIF